MASNNCDNCEERRINLELREKINKLIECKGDSCEVKKMLEAVRVVEKFHKAEADAYREAIDSLVRKVFKDKGGKE